MEEDIPYINDEVFNTALAEPGVDDNKAERVREELKHCGYSLDSLAHLLRVRLIITFGVRKQ